MIHNTHPNPQNSQRGALLNCWFHVQLTPTDPKKLSIEWWLKWTKDWDANVLLSHADLAGCTNGASISAFPGRPSPLSLLVLNINKSQTRKSQLNGCVEAAVAEIDAECQKRGAAKAGPGCSVNLKSVQLTSFTEAALFERAAPDWEQCKDPKPEGLKGRLHYSTILNVDEAYRFLKMLGLAPSTSQKSDVVSDGASELNRLLQTGRSSFQLKTGVSYGSGSGLVNVTGVGNAHFSGFLPVVRGEAGSHHPATLERMVVCTGRPCEPHSPLPACLVSQLGPGFAPWLWVPLLPQMIPLLGLKSEALQYEYAEQTFQKAAADECDGTGASASTQGNIDEFLPSKHGYIIHLADGTETRT